jgi:hypothetical protein
MAAICGNLRLFHDFFVLFGKERVYALTDSCDSQPSTSRMVSSIEDGVPQATCELIQRQQMAIRLQMFTSAQAHDLLRHLFRVSVLELTDQYRLSA